MDVDGKEVEEGAEIMHRGRAGAHQRTLHYSLR